MTDVALNEKIEKYSSLLNEMRADYDKELTEFLGTLYDFGSKDFKQAENQLKNILSDIQQFEWKSNEAVYLYRAYDYLMNVQKELQDMQSHKSDFTGMKLTSPVLETINLVLSRKTGKGMTEAGLFNDLFEHLSNSLLGTYATKQSLKKKETLIKSLEQEVAVYMDQQEACEREGILLGEKELEGSNDIS